MLIPYDTMKKDASRLRRPECSAEIDLDDYELPAMGTYGAEAAHGTKSRDLKWTEMSDSKQHMCNSTQELTQQQVQSDC